MSARAAGVFFDIGGVLVALDGMPALSRLLGLGESRDEIHRRWLACRTVVLHETGRLTPEEFAQGIVVDLAMDLSPEAFLAEFEGWLTGPHPGAFELVNEIPPSYHVAALSNMSATHWNRIKTMGWPDRFNAAFVSCEIRHLKPSREAFELALREMALPAANVLFLDDSDVNVQAARAMGINAHVVMNPAEARALLERHGVLPKNAQAPGR
jgi:putative hydrolase of the HAD superfamily